MIEPSGSERSRIRWFVFLVYVSLSAGRRVGGWARMRAIAGRIFYSLSDLDLCFGPPLLAYNCTWFNSSALRYARTRLRYKPSASEYTQSSRPGWNIRLQVFEALKYWQSSFITRIRSPRRPVKNKTDRAVPVTSEEAQQS